MIILGTAAIAVAATWWAAAHCPLGRAIAYGMNGFAETARARTAPVDRPAGR
jgi:hypothetical protein